MEELKLKQVDLIDVIGSKSKVSEGYVFLDKEHLFYPNKKRHT
jgi:antitoxin component HigA of HigAB toxin-antitoxin module